MSVKVQLEGALTAESVTDEELQNLYQEWVSGYRNKSEIERTEFAVFGWNGKFITKLWRTRLGKETQKKLKQPEKAFVQTLADNRAITLAKLVDEARTTGVWGSALDACLNDILAEGK